MNKILNFFICIILFAGCSFNQNSKFWTASKNIPEEITPKYQEIFVEEKTLEKELNVNITINLENLFNKDLKTRNYFNNDGRLKYDGALKKSSRYKFSKIKNFYHDLTCHKHHHTLIQLIHHLYHEDYNKPLNISQNLL